MPQREVDTLPIPGTPNINGAISKEFTDIIGSHELSDMEIRARFAELLEVRAGETLIAEVHTLLSIYSDRVVTYADETGDTVLEFATRNTEDPKNPWLDDVYKITEDEQGGLSYEVRIMQSKTVGWEFTIDSNRSVHVESILGSYRLQIRPETEQEADALEEMVHTSIETARKVHDRQLADEAGAARADEQAQAMLLSAIRAQYPDARAA